VENLTPELQKKWDALNAAQDIKLDSDLGSFSPSSQPSPLQGEGESAISSSYDEVYKAAGTKFGVPWQILYGIHMTETGGRNGAIMSGYGSGARGPMQFMPGTFQAYAVDGDGDGKPDIDDAVDAIYTAANYLAKHGDLLNGLRSYGGNIAGTLALAKDRGFSE
jgi:membrane-bound lytic murein transglycosylase B